MSRTIALMTALGALLLSLAAQASAETPWERHQRKRQAAKERHRDSTDAAWDRYLSRREEMLQRHDDGHLAESGLLWVLHREGVLDKPPKEAPPEPAAPPEPVTPPEPVAPPEPVEPVKPVTPVEPVAPPKPVTPPKPVEPPKLITPAQPDLPPERVAPPKPVTPPAVKPGFRPHKVKKYKGKWQWPLAAGIVSSEYGKRWGRNHHGMDIAADMGEPVFASAPGKVIYSDNKLRGYGNVVILRHDNKMTSTYAHNKKNLVKKGDQVRKGQEIALLGSTGRSTGPHIHFELRKKKKAVNPRKLLPKSRF